MTYYQYFKPQFRCHFLHETFYNSFRYSSWWSPYFLIGDLIQSHNFTAFEVNSTPIYNHRYNFDSDMSINYLLHISHGWASPGGQYISNDTSVTPKFTYIHVCTHMHECEYTHSHFNVNGHIFPIPSWKAVWVIWLINYLKNLYVTGSHSCFLGFSSLTAFCEVITLLPRHTWSMVPSYDQYLRALPSLGSEALLLDVRGNSELYICWRTGALVRQQEVICPGILPTL